ncbi:MAG: hypothetical protein JWQ09_3465 [Segetibacter sp.]|nr:hypothetical protein [Segetibacter sp.]
MQYHNLSKHTFPINQKIKQHSSKILDNDRLTECTLLARMVLGVPCHGTTTSGESKISNKEYFLITPVPFIGKMEKESKEYEAFINYFYKNFGKQEGRCYFATEFEAFYNIVKAWKVWKEILTNEEKKKYFSKI